MANEDTVSRLLDALEDAFDEFEGILEGDDSSGLDVLESVSFMTMRQVLDDLRDALDLAHLPRQAADVVPTRQMLQAWLDSTKQAATATSK